MTCERSTSGCAESRNNIQNTRRKTRLSQETLLLVFVIFKKRIYCMYLTYFKEKFADVESSERSLFSGFEDNGVTTSKSRTNFPSKHQKRKVPGNDLSSNAYGFMQRLNMIVSVSWNCKPMNLIRPPYTSNRKPRTFIHRN